MAGMNETLRKHLKEESKMEDETRKTILDALQKNRFCKVLDSSRLDVLIENMENFEFNPGDIVTKESDPGTYFFVIQDGHLEESASNACGRTQMGPGGTFGGIALLYHLRRTATVRAKTKCILWGVEGKTFRRELRSHAARHAAENRQVLDQMGLFDGLSPAKKETLAKMPLFTESFEAGRTVFKRGTLPVTIYVVKSGTLRCEDGGGVQMQTLRAGDCFGWRGILYSEDEGSVVVDEKCELVGMGVADLRKVLGDDLPGVLMKNFVLTVLRKSVFYFLSGAFLDKVAENVHVSLLRPREKISDEGLFSIVVDGEVLDKEPSLPVSLKRGHFCLNTSLCHLEDTLGNLSAGFQSARLRGLAAGDEGCRLATLSEAGLTKTMGELGLSCAQGDALQYLHKALLVKKVPVFWELSDEQMDKMVACAELVRFQPQARIITQGEVGEAVFIIAKGRVRISVGEKEICQSGQGACFGERALILQEPRAATVDALDSTVELWSIARKAFEEAIPEGMRRQLARSLDLHGTNVSMKSLKHVRLIGVGAFGSVRLVEHKRTGCRFALKRIRKVNGQIPEEVKRECTLLAEHAHPFLLEFVDTFETATSVYILTELITGGQLYQQVLEKMGCLSRKFAQFYIGALAMILESLHNHSIVYRDLKPENVMLDHQGYVKLVDFGLAKKLDDSLPRTYTMAGTLMYMAPEVLLNNGYGFECDIWSLGVIFYEFVCGSMPFLREDDAQGTVGAILDQPLEFPDSYNDVSGKKLLQGMLTKEPAGRLGNGPDGWKDIKDHKYFKQGVSGSLFKKISGREMPAPFLPEGEEYPSEQLLKEQVFLSDSGELGEDEPMDFGCRLLRTFDAEGTGEVGSKELSSVLMRLAPQTFTQDVCNELFDTLDTKKAGTISYDKFVAWILNEEAPESLREAIRSSIKLDVHAA